VFYRLLQCLYNSIGWYLCQRLLHLVVTVKPLAHLFGKGFQFWRGAGAGARLGIFAVLLGLGKGELCFDHLAIVIFIQEASDDFIHGQ
jgi:hypothetical protein